MTASSLTKMDEYDDFILYESVTDRAQRQEAPDLFQALCSWGQAKTEGERKKK